MIRIVIQDENGNDVSEAFDAPTHALAQPNDTNFSCLRFVDPYGDTVFNRLQMDALIGELRLLRQRCLDANDEIVLRRVEALAEQCRSVPHSYLKLTGD